MPHYLIIFFSVVLTIFCLLYSAFILDSILTNMSIKYIDVSSSKKATKTIREILNKLDLRGATFFDLGSGRGALAIRIKRLFPQFDVYGFDRSIFKIYFSRIRTFFAGQKVFFVRQNIFNVDLSNADIIYVYTWPETMVRLKDKFEKELKSGAIVIASTFPVPDWEPAITQETLMIKKDPDFEKIYVYKR